MLTQWIKAFGASLFLIVGTLAMFDPAGAAQIGTIGQDAAHEIA